MLCQGPRLQTLKITEAWLKGKRGWLTRSKGSGVNWESPGPPPNSGWHILMEARNPDFFVFLGPHPRHMESPRLGVKSELQLPATATRDLSCICDLHHILRQCQILNPLSEARDPTCVFMDACQIYFRSVMKGTPNSPSYLSLCLLSVSPHLVVVSTGHRPCRSYSWLSPQRLE